MKYRKIKEFKDCVLLRRIDNGNLILRDNEGDIIAMRVDNGDTKGKMNLDFMVDMGYKYSLSAIHRERKNCEAEWRKNNIEG